MKRRGFFLDLGHEFEVGLFFRKTFRLELEARGLEYLEDKGLLGSTFVVYGTDEQLAPIYWAVGR